MTAPAPHFIQRDIGTPRDPFLCWVCPTCHGCGHPCHECVAAAGDPRPENFTAPELCQAYTCGCGRAYGVYSAGRSACYVMWAPGRTQVAECVRCGVGLPAGLAGAAKPVQLTMAVPA